MNIVDEAKELIPWLEEESLIERMSKEIERLREALNVIHSHVTDMPKNISPDLANALFSVIRYQTSTALGEKE